MSDMAISVVGLDKAFRVWKHPRDMLLEVLLGQTRHTQFQALTSVSFDVPRGSVVGIMGRNGAGKSTLLRIVAGTLDATSGHAVVNGRVSAILELGTGFHADYTGRENVFLGGMCLGLSRTEVAAKFDEIVDFAELREFIDQPFKTYSSGMQARLTFAVATSIDPDILIVDEALGVGDARFQLKSFDRIRKFRERGKSILLVSHNINQIVSICDHAILLERGRIHAQGDPNSIGNIYHEMLFGSPHSNNAAKSETSNRLDADPPQLRTAAPHGSQEQDSIVVADALNAKITALPKIETAKLPSESHVVFHDRHHRYGLRSVEISDLRITQAGMPVNSLKTLASYAVEIDLSAIKASTPIHVGILLRNQSGMEVYGWDSSNAGHQPLRAFEPGERRTVALSFKANLNSGIYFLTAAVAQPDTTKEDVIFDALEVRVESAPHMHTNSITNLDVAWNGPD